MSVYKRGWRRNGGIWTGRASCRSLALAISTLLNVFASCSNRDGTEVVFFKSGNLVEALLESGAVESSGASVWAISLIRFGFDTTAGPCEPSSSSESSSVCSSNRRKPAKSLPPLTDPPLELSRDPSLLPPNPPWSRLHSEYTRLNESAPL